MIPTLVDRWRTDSSLLAGNKKPGQIPYEVRLPSVPLGVVREVVAKPGTGTAAFNVHSGQAVVYGDLLIDGQKRGESTWTAKVSSEAGD